METDNNLVKAGCETSKVRQQNSESVGPQFCGADIADAYKAYAIDPMNYQSKLQYMEIAEGVLTSKNRYFQANIDAAAAAANRILRFGSLASVTGGFEKYGIAAGASDFADISDNFGTNVKKIQGWSEYSALKSLIISQIRIISDNTSQVSQTWTYNTINPDMIVTPSVINIAATRTKQDQQTNLTIAYGVWILNSNHYLETTAIAGAVAYETILEVSGIRNVSQFVQM